MSDESLVEKPPLKKKNYIKRIQELIEEKTKQEDVKIAIFTHPCPDPDAIGSMMGLSWVFDKKFDIEVDCFYDGNISHPQNMAMCNLLDPSLKDLSLFQKDDYNFFILVDTVPAHAAVDDHTIDFDLVIDHHKEVPNGGFKGLFLNLKAGSCCGTVYNIIKSYELEFDDDNDQDTKVATGILVGIATDTENLLSDDTTSYEFEAYGDLFEYRNPQILKQIICYKRPKSWIEAKASAASNAHVDENGIAVVGLNFVISKQRDLIADVADEMLTWANVETSIAFAIVDGDRIEGSVRSSNASLSVPALCKDLGGKYGTGGGKLGKGAFRFGLGGLAVDDEDDEETRMKMWEFIKEKEIKSIYRIVKSG